MAPMPPGEWPADLSPDGRYSWDGRAWQPNPISPDGHYFGYRGQWHPLPAAPGEPALSSRTAAELAAQPMVWRQKGLRKVQLMAGSELLATLEGSDAALIGGSGVHHGKAADGAWTMTEPSLLHPGRVVVTDDATGAVVAGFESRLVSSFELTTPGGWLVTLRRKGIMQDWEWVGIDQQQLVYLGRFAMPNWSTPAEEREVKIQPAAAEMPDLSLLLILGQFLSRTVEIHH